MIRKVLPAATQFTKPRLAPEPLTKDEWPALESVSPGHSWPSQRQAVQVEIFKFQ